VGKTSKKIKGVTQERAAGRESAFVNNKMAKTSWRVADENSAGGKMQIYIGNGKTPRRERKIG